MDGSIITPLVTCFRVLVGKNVTAVSINDHNLSHPSVLIYYKLTCLLHIISTTFRGWGYFAALPSSPPSSSQDLDISLMYSMIRNTVKIRPPGKGWGKTPDINNTNEADDLERIREHRNRISHGNSSKMSTRDFNESTLDLIMVNQ